MDGWVWWQPRFLLAWAKSGGFRPDAAIGMEDRGSSTGLIAIVLAFTWNVADSPREKDPVLIFLSLFLAS